MTTKKKRLAKTAGSSKFRIIEVANQAHHTIARRCDYCGKPMTPSDVNDFGTLCETCYMKEYYPSES